MTLPLQKHYDNIIIGGGHNGLICAAYLARKGQSVLVLEASDNLGGLATTREFHPGFKVGIAHSLNHFSSKIVRDLELEKHGFYVGAPMSTLGLDLEGQHIKADTDCVVGVETCDVNNYQKYLELLRRFSSALAPFWMKTMPRIGNNTIPEIMTFAQLGLKLRGLGKNDMGEFMRIVTLPARDLMDEYFENDLLKAVLSWDGLIGSKMAPRSPNATVLGMLYRMSGEHQGVHSIPTAGIESLIIALSRAASTAGADIQTLSPVARICVNGDRNGLKATGVELIDGEKINADRIISSADPKRTFLDLLGAQYLEIEFTNRISRLRCDGYVAKLHLALDSRPEFLGVNQLDQRMIIAPTMDSIEFAFDNAKYGECPEHPVMEITLPSAIDHSMAPGGKHVLSAHVMYVPYRLKGGWTNALRETLKTRLIDIIGQYAPDLPGKILHSELLTPADLEQNFHVTGGHWHHTELSMDQMLMMRPTYEAAQYETPVPGLFLCGAGCHPGGDLMGGPGHNAAKHILGL